MTGRKRLCIADGTIDLPAIIHFEVSACLSELV
jgi:hypothetical protein